MPGSVKEDVRPARVVLAGANGHGRSHLRTLAALAAVGRVDVVGLCDVRPVQAPPPLDDVEVDADLPRMLARTRPDVTIVCTPIHTHMALATAALEAGSHLLLEKPPAPTLAEHHALLRTVERTGAACQIGFQSFGSTAVAHVERLLADGTIGELRGIGAAGAWVRDRAYFTRARWAGRRQLDGRPVVDGVLTNPFAHATATALRLDGSDGPKGVADIRVELFHANDIEADDTSCLVATTARGTRIVVAVSLCAEEHHDPFLLLHGTRGRIRLHYKTHRVRVEVDGAVTETAGTEIGLLDNLLDHVADPTVPLLAPLHRTLGFGHVIEAVRTAAEPAPITPPHARMAHDGDVPRVVVPGIDDLVVRCAEELRSYRELGAPWAAAAASAPGSPPAPSPSSADREVAS